ncbi:uncharacterized protein F4807DRAFT_117507 [Annulohypoxylon truncatum]|uniref:uncharacterized protein n=1 Tax=Annulohypoxylon truncatum TaxID=327061 RepID=UPI002007F795|nr:uncharacterized protein F4807DRAFT_117507 [Annulohypoxylon truncatum]KAI1214183.1 hypothetical protein F4807DRAFT_117507 [Annulohypoxylon truncatum]
MPNPSTRPRTRRPNQTTFTRPFPAAVTYDLSVPDQATITVPLGSSWTSGPHWHEAHTEFLEVLAGRARVTLGSRTLVVGVGAGMGNGDGVLRVERGVVHEWRRASREDEEEGGEDGGAGGREVEGEGEGEGEDVEELVVKEWTEPKDGAKEVFFRNLNGLVLDAAGGGGGGGGWRSALLELELWNLFWRADNYPVVLGTGAGWVRRVATKMVMGAAVALGWVLGCRGVYEEYGLGR